MFDYQKVEETTSTVTICHAQDMKNYTQGNGYHSIVS